MKVRDVMNPGPKVCQLTDNLSAVAGVMWQNDCGILPVVADGEKVIGLITDRDICMAANLTGQTLWKILVEDVVSGDVYDCKPDDDILSALKTMREKKVRRLPVIDAEGKLVGILSINDVVLKVEDARGKKSSAFNYADVVDTYKAISQHSLPMQLAQANA